MVAHLTINSMKTFKKCYISSAVDETDSGMLWNDREEVGNVRTDC
jgi:hypothetical protein